MIRERRFAAGAALVLALALTTACTPSPAPTPTSTGFASEEEAFAAAEAIVRSYFDAANHIDLEDPQTFEALFALSTGEQNDFDRKRYSQYNAEGYEIIGAAKVLTVVPVSWEPVKGTALMDACLDVSAIELIRSDGSSAVSPGRPDYQDLQITLDANARTFLVESISGSGRQTCD